MLRLTCATYVCVRVNVWITFGTYQDTIKVRNTGGCSDFKYIDFVLHLFIFSIYLQKHRRSTSKYNKYVVKFIDSGGRGLIGKNWLFESANVQVFNYISNGFKSEPISKTIN